MALNFEDIVLEKEQENLLIALIEAARRQPREDRRPFAASKSSDGTVVVGLKNYSNPYYGDIEALTNEGLIQVTRRQQYSMVFDVSPLGFRYYEYLMKSRGEAVERVEENIFRYLDTSGFEKRHPEAFAKWRQAEGLLWSSDSQSQHTAIGHHCREAMQFFATSLVEAYSPPDVDPNPANTVSRVRAVLNLVKPQISDKIVVMLDALLHYWGTTIDLAQRQEHGAQKEGEALTWEDSRRLVFHTALVMVEIDRTLKDIRP